MNRVVKVCMKLSKRLTQKECIFILKPSIFVAILRVHNRLSPYTSSVPKLGEISPSGTWIERGPVRSQMFSETKIATILL